MRAEMLGAMVLLAAGECLAQPAAVPMCERCHGASGEGGLTGAPPLAGLSREYLAAQLDAYADGRRQHPLMTPIARALAPADREDLAGYFSRLTRRVPPPQLGQAGATTVAVDRRPEKL